MNNLKTIKSSKAIKSLIKDSPVKVIFVKNIKNWLARNVLKSTHITREIINKVIINEPSGFYVGEILVGYRCILIKNGMSIQKTLYALCHERGHAYCDTRHCSCMNGTINEMRSEKHADNYARRILKERNIENYWANLI